MEDVISSAEAPAAQAAALPDRLEEADALALELCASQLEAIALQAEIVALRRKSIETRIEAKYSILAGRDSVDLPKRTISRGV